MVKMKMKMCVLFVILALVSQHASGVEVEVYEGDESVQLPCQFAAPISEDHVIVWRRDDLGSPIIHSIVDGNVDLSSQNKRYTNRTSMRAEALQTGDISLTLRNPTFTDSGTYTCLTRKGGDDKQRTEVQLKVTERPPVWPIILSIVMVGIVLLLSAFFVFLLYRVKERQNSRTVCLLTPLEVREWAPSVLLPYKTERTLTKDLTVKWIVVNREECTACVFENGQIQNDQHDNKYKNVTKMRADALTAKDLSLTLNYPIWTDTGVFICSIYDKDGKTLEQKTVTLVVKESLWKSIRAALGCPVDEPFSNVQQRMQKVCADETSQLNDQPV